MGSTNNPINDFFLDFHHMCLMLHCYCKEKSCLGHLRLTSYNSVSFILFSVL